MKIEGMMCGHCENAVKTALEAVEGVETVTADAKAGTATIRLQPGTSEEALAEAVKKAGYVPTVCGGRRRRCRRQWPYENREDRRNDVRALRKGSNHRAQCR